MPMAKNPIMFTMIGTPFTKEGRIDEPAYRAQLRRQVAAKNGVYLGSGGAAEAHALSVDELKVLYRIGVEECKGKVPTYANPREPRSAAAMIEVCQQAIKAGVDVVQVYPLDGGHGMRPTLQEQEAYYRTVLGAIRPYPAAISVHVSVGYMAPASLIAKMVNEHKHVQTLNLMGPPLTYFAEMRDLVGPNIDFFVGVTNVIPGLAMGARGLMQAEGNLTPFLLHSIVDQMQAGDIAAAGETYLDLMRLFGICNKWSPSTARYVKMGWKVLGLPGGNGYLREPYRLPPQAELDQMAALFKKMRLSELEAAAEKAAKAPTKKRK